MRGRRHPENGDTIAAIFQMPDFGCATNVLASVCRHDENGDAANPPIKKWRKSVAIFWVATRLLPFFKWRILGAPPMSWRHFTATTKMATPQIRQLKNGAKVLPFSGWRQGRRHLVDTVTHARARPGWPVQAPICPGPALGTSRGTLASLSWLWLDWKCDFRIPAPHGAFWAVFLS